MITTRFVNWKLRFESECKLILNTWGASLLWFVLVFANIAPLILIINFTSGFKDA